MSGGDAPLILTAELPVDLHGRFTDLRTEHFPPERNYLEAHVTLFHALPAQCEDEVRRYLARLVGETAPVEGRVEGLMSLGGGTAIKLVSPDMLDLRHRIADHFQGMLTNQDQHRPRLHVTIQNKVTSKEAKALQAQLSGVIQPRDFAFRGLALYAYRGGPWEFLRRFAFRGK
ncbi:2'-5' RNA ligase family protein [Qipengyuania nanhaisediminis]|uniref:2'-5' RNA ligase superfamily protein n=1 Tax=Qipengyuania nanhaisediminis TaxID=604088 RepID=A0A1I5P1A3_9SPHN|nr:2'-5' RNA ligase family protein [Qipengyuania nanhaisediminis]SFP27829.1 2'-5' RNA ligase superfamily protein [Qipengyuania nanhaisediminis]